MSQPRFSVLIPTCHRNDLLAKCLAALAPGRQTLGEPFEVIVSDDGSRETAEALINENFPWACWTPGPKRGPAANRNHAASLATGDWLAFTDDDCIPAPGWLAGYAAAIDAEIKVYEGRTTTDYPLKGPRFQAPVNENGGYLWSCNLLLARETFDRLGGFDEGFPYPHLEDVDLRLRLEALGEKPKFTPAAEILHPQRPATPWLRRARSKQSSVYLCHKYGRPLSFANLDPLSFARMAKRALTGPGPAVDKLARIGGLAAEFLYLIPMVPYWKYQYSKR
ncbi:glycosyltransferase [Ruficoccus amylovorans]|uniref:Glycosyltransferase n=1 Tax=Ruficoccus amylovorans TaxID=1804625 RepID=A0A842HDE0_9BACT|nr:glycosyltransferase [Ruficoccus amylovorans]MBC2594545.1 glycosyltransferase [Ruficoccus amylovorans]